MKVSFLSCLFIGCAFFILCFENDLIAKTSTDEIILTEGLVIKLPRARRALFSIDPIEKIFVLSNWVSPKAGDKITVGDEEAIWESINADTTGWFISNALRSGYVYIPFESDQDKIMLLEGMGHEMVYINGAPRAGNRYGYKDTYDSWEPSFDYSILPIDLKKGKNDLLFRGSRTSRLKVKLWKLKSSVMFNTKDMTLPDFIVGEKIDTRGAVVVINASHESLKDLKISARLGNDQPIITQAPIIAPMTIRKIGFQLKGEALSESDSVDVNLQLHQNNKILDQATIQIRVTNRFDTHKRTFISHIDGSVQYYAINPAQTDNSDEPVALILSVHGAGVKALNQAHSYKSKTWAHIVAPTNRRPYGFNWEDWGRLDALEAYDVVTDRYNIDPSRIYLTGHSMGGHGSWHLGSLFPDRFGAIGPSAGWLSFWSYRVREEIEDETPMAKMLMRPNLPSNTFVMAENYNQLGVYILHGSDDDNVPADQSRQMAAHLEKFHKDFIYHEQAGAGHWWDNSDEPGADCLDWPPLFDFFARHARPGQERIRQVDFLVANPGISAQNNWVCVEAQQEQLSLSKLNIQFDPGKKRFIGATENIARLSLDVGTLLSEGPVSVELDSQKIENIDWKNEVGKIWLQLKANQWSAIEQPSLDLKGPHRYGTFKDAFKNRMIFVYGTKGNAEENQWAFIKARYDAERFWYQGNGLVDVIQDTEFDPLAEPDRNVILYGNAQTNQAWNALLNNSPVVVKRGQIKIRDRSLKGDDLGCLFIRPRPNSDIACVGVVSGTGIMGMRMTERRPYLAPGYAYPDLMIFNSDMLTKKIEGVKVAGFFGLDWSVEKGEFVWGD